MNWQIVAAATVISGGLWLSHPGQTSITIPDRITIQHDVSGAVQLAPGVLSLDVNGIPTIPPISQLIPDTIRIVPIAPSVLPTIHVDGP